MKTLPEKRDRSLLTFCLFFRETKSAGPCGPSKTNIRGGTKA